MNRRASSLLTAIFFLATFSGPYFGQTDADFEQLGSWITDLNVYPVEVYARLDRYSRVDLERFKEKLSNYKKGGTAPGWEGNYIDELTQLGTTQFRINFQSGFAQFYVYSCVPELRWINHGKVVDGLDTIQTISEVESKPSEPQLSKTYVKVIWGNRRYLVEETSLAAFAQKAAGLYLEPDDSSHLDFQRWADYWVDGSYEDEVVGLPKFPPRFAHLERAAIRSAISGFGKRSTKDDFHVGNSVYTNAVIYPVTLRTGKTSGVKVGMSFAMPETQDVIWIKSVGPKVSEGLLVRYRGEDGTDECLNNSDSLPSTCKKLRAGMVVETRTGQFHY